MNRFLILSIFVGYVLTATQAQDWSEIPVPADPGDGFIWELADNYSDDFNYAGKASEEFTSKWNHKYHNAWTGPGLTEWNSNHSDVADGNLIITVSRKQGTDKVLCGVITSKTKLIYPIYMEAKIKASNQVLSSNFWLLSEDDTRELDILEVYGGDRDDQTWFAQRMSTNFHIFERDPKSNAILNNFDDQTHHTLPGLEPWRNDFHRYGVYWKSPTHITFYIDGEEKNTFTDVNMESYDDNYIDREMFMIIDTEDHAWRSDQGLVATNEELADESKNKMLVDWVRVYKPIEGEDTKANFTNKEKNFAEVYPNPIQSNSFFLHLNENEGSVRISIMNLYGNIMSSFISNNKIMNIDTRIFAKSGLYILRVETDEKSYTHKLLVRKLH